MTNILEPTGKTFNSYLFFWGGQLFSLFGSSIASFVVVWWITIKTNSPIFLSLSAFLSFGTQLLVMPFAGVFIDRWNRKKILGFADISEAIVTFVLIVMFWIDLANIYWILGILTIRGFFQGIRDGAINAIIPVMVPKNSLTRINSLNYLMNGTIFVIGPIIASLLISIFSINNMPLLLSIDTITFVTALIPLILITIPKIKNSKIDANFKKEFRDGITIIKENRGLIALLFTSIFANFFLTPIGVLLPLIVINSALKGNASMLALILAFEQGGSIFAATILTIKKSSFNNSFGVLLGLIEASIGIIIFSLGAFFGQILLCLIGISIQGLGLVYANVHSQNIWQVAIPLEYQGRALAVRRFVGRISLPISMGLVGFIALMIGEINVVLYSSVIFILILFYLWNFTDLADIDELVQHISEESSAPSLDLINPSKT